jgi:hypothetical protein
MSAPLRIAPFIGGLLFIVLALGIALPPLSDVLNDPDPVDGLGADAAVVLMVLFFAAAPAFVGVHLIQRATRGEPGAVAATAHMGPAPAIAEAPPAAHALTNGATTASPMDQSPVALPPSYDAALPPPPSVRRAEAEFAVAGGAAQAGSWLYRLRALRQSSLGLAVVVAVLTIPLMVLLRPEGVYVATVALMIYAIAEIWRSAAGQSWFIPALTSAGIGMMLFIVLGATAGALEQGEGNNPVLVLPGILFYAGIALTGVVRLFSRR